MGAAPKPAAFLRLLETPGKPASNSSRRWQLDPNNREAVANLFEYYLEAPGFLGGGVEKAEAVIHAHRQAECAGGAARPSPIGEQAEAL